MKFSVLGSGSRGNAVYIESGSTGILIDAGFSGKELERRLQSIGRTLSDVKALCLTHEHNDHISGAGVVSRRCKVPIYANGATFKEGENRLGRIHSRKEFETGDQMVICDLKVRSFRISHDSVDPVGFVVGDGKSSIGYCTDTGKVSHLMARRLAQCNGLILEFNHNLEMLRNGPYPLPLQQRVRSSKGHLCNEAAARFFAELPKDDMKCVVQAHLSEKNNTPELARNALLEYAKDWPEAAIYLAQQDRALKLLDLSIRNS